MTKVIFTEITFDGLQIFIAFAPIGKLSIKHSYGVLCAGRWQDPMIVQRCEARQMWKKLPQELRIASSTQCE
jgi:hypothetical protein